MAKRKQPWWNEPGLRRIRNELAKAEIDRVLQEQGLHHLKVVGRGVHLVVYSETDGHKFNRIRFTRLAASDRYQLGFATHTERWEETPFEGTLSELLTMVLEQFPFTIQEL